MSSPSSAEKNTPDFAEVEHAVNQERSHDPEELKLSQIVTVVEGTTRLYANGNLRYIPAPSPDPRDPLNLPNRVKYFMIVVLCFYGSIAFSTQTLLATLLPVFVVEYADPAAMQMGGLNSTGDPAAGAFPSSGGAAPSGLAGAAATGPSGSIPTEVFVSVTTSAPASTSTKVNPNPLAELANYPGAPPLWKINLIASLPVLVVGLSNYFLVPLSIIFGRRPVLLVCATLAWVCTLWAGRSKSLNEHIAARCVQAIGAGAVESLVPYIVQDICFIHQRNRGIGIIWASQGITTLVLGISSTYIVDRLGWRWLYYVLVVFGGIAWILVMLFIPETRWSRSAAELRGESEYLAPGQDRVAIDHENFPARTTRLNLAVFQGGVHLTAGITAVKEIFRSLFFPNVMVIVLLNAALIGISLASGSVATPVLLAPPYSWPLSKVGLLVIGLFVSSIFVYLFGGFGADRIANLITKRRGGVREPEVHLLNLIFPLAMGIFGCILYGAGGEYSDKLSWAAIIIGTAMINFSFLTVNIIGSVYCIECYPAWAGPVLVNAASFRNIIGFAFAFGVVDWVAVRGYMDCFAIFAGAIGLLCFAVAGLFLFGKRLRKRTNGLLKQTTHSD